MYFVLSMFCICGHSQTTYVDRKNKTKTAVPGYDSPMCNKFALNSLMNKHIKFIHEGASIKCNICGVTSKNKEYLRDHIRVVHEGKKRAKNHKCSICNNATI